MTQYVQAWECKGDKFNGYVYSHEALFRQMAENTDLKVTAVTIVRHDNGDREHLRGCLAASVQRHREKVTNE